MRDYVRPITKLIANGEAEKIGSAVRKGLDDIQAEIGALRRQEALLRGLMDFYARPSPTELAEEKAPAVAASTYGDGLSSQDRSRLVRETALELARQGQGRLSAGDVVQALATRGITFSIRRPNSMAGTVLAVMPEFRKEGPNVFEYVGGNETQAEPTPFWQRSDTESEE